MRNKTNLNTLNGSVEQEMSDSMLSIQCSWTGLPFTSRILSPIWSEINSAAGSNLLI